MFDFPNYISHVVRTGPVGFVDGLFVAVETSIGTNVLKHSCLCWKQQLMTLHFVLAMS